VLQSPTPTLMTETVKPTLAVEVFTIDIVAVRRLQRCLSERVNELPLLLRRVLAKLFITQMTSLNGSQSGFQHSRSCCQEPADNRIHIQLLSSVVGSTARL